MKELIENKRKQQRLWEKKNKRDRHDVERMRNFIKRVNKKKEKNDEKNEKGRKNDFSEKERKKEIFV